MHIKYKIVKPWQVVTTLSGRTSLTDSLRPNSFPNTYYAYRSTLLQSHKIRRSGDRAQKPVLY